MPPLGEKHRQCGGLLGMLVAFGKWSSKALIAGVIPLCGFTRTPGQAKRTSVREAAGAAPRLREYIRLWRQPAALPGDDVLAVPEQMAVVVNYATSDHRLPLAKPVKVALA